MPDLNEVRGMATAVAATATRVASATRVNNLSGSALRVSSGFPDASQEVAPYRICDHIPAVVEQLAARDIAPDCWPRLMPTWGAWLLFVAVLAICAIPVVLAASTLPTP